MMIWHENKKVALVEFEESDKHLIKDLDSDEEVMRYISNGVPSDDKEVKRAMDAFLGWKKKHEGKYGYWKAILKSNSEFIGWFHLRPLKSNITDFENLELGYRLKRKFWGKGIATEVSKEILKIAFEKLQAKNVWAITMKKNIASQRVMQKIGMNFNRDDVFEEFPGVDKESVWYLVKMDEMV